MMDDNLISYTGNKEGRIWRNGILLFEAKPLGDTTVRVAYETGLQALLNEALNAGRKIADVLKFSGARDLVVKVDGLVPGGYEDCVDVNNECKNVAVIAGGYSPNGKYVSTIKGGSKDIFITGDIFSKAKELEHDLGNWSDQSYAVTKRVHLNTCGSNVRYRVLNAEKPILVAGDYKCVFCLPAFLRPVFVAVFAIIKRVFG